jgi:hypothetical protein
MYRLKKDPLSNMFSETSDFGLSTMFNHKSNKMDVSCILYTVIKILIVVYLVHLFYKMFIKKYEFYDINVSQKDGKTSLHDVLTEDCKPEYCNAQLWSPLNSKTVATNDKKQKIPAGFQLNNYSTANGCCVIPDKLSDYINVGHGNNRIKMEDINDDIKMTTYIRDS